MKKRKLLGTHNNSKKIMQSMLARNLKLHLEVVRLTELVQQQETKIIELQTRD